MAYQLEVAMIEAIRALKARRWSNRQIGRALGVDRDTVARHLQQANAAKAPTGSAASQEAAGTGSEEAGLTPALSSSRSMCAPFREVIRAMLEHDLSAQRIFQDLTREHGFAGEYHSVRRFVGRLRKVQAFPFRRLECGPGEEGQVDFGTGAPLLIEGKRRKTHVFRIVLSYSRKAYSEAVLRQTTDDFLHCLENAFQHFGGVPRLLTIDNLKAAVAQADWYDPELQPKIRSFCAHYGTTMLPTKPRMPRHKGKVEKGVDYVQDNALKGRKFASLAEENTFLLDWETSVADTRIHGTTRRQVGKVFAAEERAALVSLPVARFPFFQEGRRSVHRDGHVEVAKAYYSVPPEYLGRVVWARWDGKLVRIFNERLEQVAVHVQRDPGKFSTQGGHIVPEKICAAERGVGSMLSTLRQVGPHTLRWAEAVLTVRQIEGVRVLAGLLALSRKHSVPALENACDRACACASYRLRTIRELLRRDDVPRQQEFTFIEQHPLIRSLADYGQWLRATLVRRDEA